ncbi:MAG: peptidylprolyl isomerase [Lachnospiraceae bacterium]|nr:peptidylprolyl isomerase [Lachnospiraceae bacterium]
MKIKYLLLTLVLVMAFAFAGCSEKISNSDGSKSFSEDTEETSDSTEEEATSDESQTDSESSTGVAAPDGSTMDMTETAYTSIEGFDQTAAPKAGDTIITFDVEGFGEIKAKLFPEVAPYGVKNFVNLANEGYYDGLTFHRVISDFMIQGGDPEGTGMGGESIWKTPFYNEICDQACVIRGSLCYAKSQADPSIGSQFFITQLAKVTEDDLTSYEQQGVTLTDEQKKIYLKNGGAPWLQGGYTVFGQVYEGMDLVDKISKVETDESDKPTTDVIMKSVKVSTFAEE